MSCRLFNLFIGVLLVIQCFSEEETPLNIVSEISFQQKVLIPVIDDSLFTIASASLPGGFIKILRGKGRHPKLTAIGLALVLGPLGGHRIYLGTKPYIPVVYAVTLGGGLGILPLCDIVAIALCKDITVYVNNPKVVMWIPGKTLTQQ